MTRLEDCTHQWPCDCGSPVGELRESLDQALRYIGDHLRHQHLDRVRERLSPGDDALTFLPWRSLQDSERARWTDEARLAVKDGPQV